MNNKIVIANWKMKMSLRETIDLARKIRQKIDQTASNTLVLCPDFLSLSMVIDEMKGVIGVAVGAQDCFWEDSGAYTGEVSPHYLCEIGCRYVILGHSERRQYCNETDEVVLKKMKATLRQNNLAPVVCVGDVIGDFNKGISTDVIKELLVKILIICSQDFKNKEIIIAYEPVWCIGSNEVPDTEHLVSVKKMIDECMSIYGVKGKVLYGGSVNKEAVKNILSSVDFDGFLVGGASLQPNSLINILRS